MDMENICEYPQQFPPDRSLHVGQFRKKKLLLDSISFALNYRYLPFLDYCCCHQSHDDNKSILSSPRKQNFAK